MVTIQRNVPLYPKDKWGSVLKKMKVGDSFEFPRSERPRVAGSVGHYSSRHGMKFAIRTSGSKSRCWRIA